MTESHGSVHVPCWPNLFLPRSINVAGLFRRVGVCACLFAMFCVLWLAPIAPSLAQADSLVTAMAETDTSAARIEFVTPNPIRFNLSVDRDWLIIEFSEPFHGSLEPIIQQIPAVIGASALRQGGRVVRLRMRRTMTVRGYVVEPGRIAIEFIDKPDNSVQQRADRPASLVSVPIRQTALSDGTVRLVFDWKQHAEYRITADQERITVLFDRRANFIPPRQPPPAHRYEPSESHHNPAHRSS